MKFPTDPSILREWCLLINRKNKDGSLWYPGTYHRICSIHFVDGKPTETNPKPTLHLGYDPTDQKKAHRKLPTADRQPAKTTQLTSKQKTRAAKEEPKPDTGTKEVTSQDTNSAIVIKKELVQEEPVEISGNSNFDVEQAPEIDIPAQVRTPSTVKPKPNKATNHYIQLKAKIKQLEPLLMPKHKQLLRDDKSVHFYTNLPNIDTFKTICNYVKSRKRMCPEAVKPKQKTLPEYWVIRKFRARVVAEDRSLCLEDQILLTLMKLRLDLLHQDLANR